MPAILVLESPAGPIEILEKRRRGDGSGYSDSGHLDQFAGDFVELDAWLLLGARTIKSGVE